MKTRNLYDIRFRRYDQAPPPGRAGRWLRWATTAQEARTSATKALGQEYPEGFRIVSIEEAAT